MPRCVEEAGRPVRLWVPAALGILLWGALPTRAHGEAPASVSLSAFFEQIGAAERAAAGCAMRSSACDNAQLPVREEVTGAPGGAFQISWQWFGDAMASAKTAPAAERAKAMEAILAHLGGLAAEADGRDRGSLTDFGRARAAAQAALERPEFRTVDEPSWMERQLARFQDWVIRLFAGMDALGKRAPWLAPLVEWGCFGLAAGGLLLFLRRSLARQSLRIALGNSAALGPQGGRDAADWARLAEQHAAAEDWRDAVHCLYWATIALLESRRSWRPNPTRTAREYLLLVRPGSEVGRALRALTSSFETIWYGRGEAGEGEYRRALESFRAVEASRPERSTAAVADGTPLPGALAATGEA